jgi:hypothetical protein
LGRLRRANHAVGGNGLLPIFVGVADFNRPKGRGIKPHGRIKNSGPEDFLIKPYNMEIKMLKEYDEKIKSLVVQKNAAWEKHKVRSAVFPTRG